MVGCERGEPVHGEIADPDEQDWGVDGEDPQHEVED